ARTMPSPPRWLRAAPIGASRFPLSPATPDWDFSLCGRSATILSSPPDEPTVRQCAPSAKSSHISKRATPSPQWGSASTVDRGPWTVDREGNFFTVHGPRELDKSADANYGCVGTPGDQIERLFVGLPPSAPLNQPPPARGGLHDVVTASPDE